MKHAFAPAREDGPEETRLLFEGYPHHAYVRDPYGVPARSAIVYPGENSYYRIGERHLAMLDPAELNRRAGVTPAQARACEMGMVYGWDSQYANPMAYNAAGEFLGGGAR